MGAAAQKRNPYSAIWAMARELGLDNESLHDLIFAETGRSSMREMTPSEQTLVEMRLGRMKDGSRPQRGISQKRTDTEGNPATIALRKKIYALCGVLGWNNENARINGFVKKMCGVERIEWLNRAQCGKVIEGLKAMLARREGGLDE